jgi:hypothetical protein
MKRAYFVCLFQCLTTTLFFLNYILPSLTPKPIRMLLDR